MICAVGLLLYNVLRICEDIQNHSSVDIKKDKPRQGTVWRCSFNKHQGAVETQYAAPPHHLVADRGTTLVFYWGSREKYLLY